MIRTIFFILAVVFGVGTTEFAQAPPRESQRQEIIQTVGDGKVSIVYHRPNTKGRKLWGCDAKNLIPVTNYEEPCIVPYGQVWRAGANENTTIEFSRDVTINGQALPAGKYGLHMIPGKADWTVIFSRDNDKWGSFSYKPGNDALRVKVVPAKSPVQETLVYEFDDMTPSSVRVDLRWEKIAVPFTVDFGDVHGRVLAGFRDAIKARKADDFRPLGQAATYVRTFKLKANYDEALGWVEESIKARETAGNLNLKAALLAEAGRFEEAVATGDKALQLAKAQTPPNPGLVFTIEESLKKWKAKRT